MHQAQTSPSDSNRVKAVRRAIEHWRKDLVDTSGRNRLRRYRDLKTSTLDLTPGRADGLNEEALDRLLADKPVTLSSLFPKATEDDSTAFDDARRRLFTIHKSALTNREEKGIETLFIAIGLATWKVTQGTEPHSPVVLLPLDVEAAGAAARDFRIEVSGDAHLNPVLAHILRAEYEIDTDNEEADVVEAHPSSLDGFRYLLDRFKESWRKLPNLAIEPRVVAAIFSYSTMPLVADLEENGEVFAESDLVAAIAGDEEARQSLRSRICDPQPNQPDFESPTNEFLVLDADSSQQMAINRVLGGESLVIQGPPGTGKSQTIANLIATLIAQGKRVLFVAEKRAAIEAVTKRLDQVGLSNLVMDMHGGITSRRDFARTLNNSIGAVSAIPALDYSALHNRVSERRDSLIANVAALHKPRDPWRLCLFDMRVRLLATPAAARTQLRLASEAASALDKLGFEKLAEEIEEWVNLGGHVLAKDHPEWARSSIATTDEARKAFDLVTDIERSLLPAAHDVLFSVLEEASLQRPNTIGEWSSTARFLVVANGSLFGRLKAQIFSKEYRATKRATRVSGPLTLTPNKVQDVEEQTKTLSSQLGALANVTGLNDLNELTYPDFAAAMHRMASNRTVIANLPRIREIESRFRMAGIEKVIERVGEDIPPEYASHAVEHAWLSRVLDNLEFEDPQIATFNSVAHSRHRDEFAISDREHLDSNPHRVLRLTAETIITTMDSHPQEAALVKKEAAKKSRHLSIRQLFARAPHVLSALRPCWTMSPILAAEMIPAKLRLFDVVIFDEASQIPPAEAISSLTRAPQAVIAGDSRQLPPTSFFSLGATDDNEDDPDDDLALTKNIESLLDTAAALLRDKMLQWHYRSRDDRLIAFSNNHIYGGFLTAFPGSLSESPVSHYLIRSTPITTASGTRSNPYEVEKVVDLVLEHASETPSVTLGVIAFGQNHADNIQTALMRRLREQYDASLDDFFSETNEERFFVKNIERVQGDERDAIILSVGYHKDANGNLPYRFGPLLQDGGERRLNVAITRARSRLTLVSSFSHLDMVPGRSSSKGVELLRQYLEYASSGGANLGSEAGHIPLNPFELSIKEGLERRGIPVTSQYGVSGYRIDFACAHPDEPGRMVLAIEADGASYHSTPTARDRDRLRQQVLEDKGWRFHRIWSTAWFRDPEAELDKAEIAWKRAIESSNNDDKLPETLISSGNQESNSIPQRGQRPYVPRKGTRGYENIRDYSHPQLVDLARWIESDTLLRTEDDLLKEMMTELGFKRSGRLITETVMRAIRATRC